MTGRKPLIRSGGAIPTPRGGCNGGKQSWKESSKNDAGREEAIERLGVEEGGPRRVEFINHSKRSVSITSSTSSSPGRAGKEVSLVV